MSANAESKRKTAELNQQMWDAATDQEKTAVKLALSAYANSPGDSEKAAMLRACRAYVATMRLRPL